MCIAKHGICVACAMCIHQKWDAHHFHASVVAVVA